MIVEKKISSIESKEEAEILVDKINSVINKLIDNEGILIVLEENDEEDKRLLTLNINYS